MKLWDFVGFHGISMDFKGLIMINLWDLEGVLYGFMWFY